MPVAKKPANPGRFEVPGPDELLVRLARGLRHELGNILTPITAFGEMLSDLPRTDEQTQEDIAAINSAAKRGAAFADRLGDAAGLASVEASEMTLLDLAEIVEESWNSDSVRVRIIITRERGDIHFPEEADSPTSVDANAVKKIVSELLLNSERGGAENVLISISSFKGETLLRFSDDGQGVGADNLKNVAQPYWSSQYASNKGLGLSVVNGLIWAHGGKMILSEDEATKGFTVELQWPNTLVRETQLPIIPSQLSVAETEPVSI